MRQLLRTFVHVSDMHFGEICPRTGNAAVSLAADFAHQNFPLLDGLRGHQGRALEELDSFCETLRANGEDFTVICSGDFTRCGAQPEIDAAQSFFSSEVELGTGKWRGLYLGAMPKAAIPGNHDQWGGQQWPLGGGPLRPNTLIPRTLPYHFDETLAGTRHILFAALDTDADIHPLSVKRGMAIGSFQSSLRDLDAQLLLRRANGLASKDEVRVLLLHHSLSHSGPFLRMDSRSRLDLEQFIVNHEFSVLLSGHMHKSLLVPIPIRVGAARQTIRELRCGTSSQHDQFPLSWRKHAPKLFPLHLTRNCLIQHQIFSEGSQLRWVAQVFELTNHGFNKSQRRDACHEFPL